MRAAEKVTHGVRMPTPEYTLLRSLRLISDQVRSLDRSRRPCGGPGLRSSTSSVPQPSSARQAAKPSGRSVGPEKRWRNRGLVQLRSEADWDSGAPAVSGGGDGAGGSWVPSHW